MKRALILFLVLGLVLGAIATAEAGKKKKKKKVERVVEVPYMAPGIGAATPGGSAGICPFADPSAQTCIEVPPTLSEKFVKVEVKDATGLSVAGFISQGDVDGDGISDGYGTFCGAHEEAVQLAAAAPVRVSFYPGATTDCAPSIATSGTVVYTFSNLP